MKLDYQQIVFLRLIRLNYDLMRYTHLVFLLIISQFVELGVVTSIEMNHKNIDTARKGQEVCIKIEPIPGDAPKMFGRHFEETDMLVSKVSVVLVFSLLPFK